VVFPWCSSLSALGVWCLFVVRIKLVPVTGCCAAVIGLLYPYLDDILGEKRGRKQEWSSVMRCIAVFVGINHASAVSFTYLAAQ